MQALRSRIWRGLRGLLNNDILFDQPTDEEKQLRLRFLQQMLPIIIPLIFLMLSTRFLVNNNNPKTIVSIGGSTLVVVIIYVVSRTGRYYTSIITTFVLGAIIIVINAIMARAPRIEISFLFILPLVAAMLLTFTELLLIALGSILVFLVFGIVLILPHSPDVFTDLLQQSLLFNTFILFAGYQRHRLERDRRQLALTKERNDLLRFMLNSISHDLKTPLALIGTSSYFLERSLKEAGFLNRVTVIQQQVERLDQMIQNVITLSELEYDGSTSLSDCDLGESVHEATDNVRPLANDKGISIDLDIADEIPSLLANPEDLLRVITNLLENAIRYTATDGCVTVRVQATDKAVELIVEDTGIGIAPEDLPHIFEPFFRADKARDANTGGSGLGLALVKKTVEFYGGTIEASSVLDEGTIVKVNLPTTARR